MCPRKFLPLAAGLYTMVVEQRQQKRCSACFSAGAAPHLAHFMAADTSQRVSCRHIAPSASAPEQDPPAKGWDGWPGTGPLLPPVGNSDVSHESDRWLKVQATFRRIIFMAQFRS